MSSVIDTRADYIPHPLYLIMCLQKGGNTTLKTEPLLINNYVCYATDNDLRQLGMTSIWTRNPLVMPSDDSPIPCMRKLRSPLNDFLSTIYL